MTRRTFPLQHHLLTRSDLARLEILAAQLRHWQATGWLEQIGRLPDAGSLGDAVFAVHAPELRKELASRLEALGKSAVVMAPQHAKALLMQDPRDAATQNGQEPAMTQDDAATRGARDGRDAADEPPAAKPVETWDTDGALAEHLFGNDLPQVLQEAAAELAAEVEGGLAMSSGEPPAHENNLDATATDTLAAPFEADELDVDELQTALANWDPWEQDAAMNDLDARARPATRRARASEPPEPPAPKSPAVARESDTMVPVIPAAARSTDSATSAMRRVESCLGELRSTMAAMTHRPEPAAVDLRPILEVFQTGLEGASRQTAALNATVVSLAEHLRRSGPHDERDACRTVAEPATESVAARTPATRSQVVAVRDVRLLIALLVISVLALCWSLMLWFRTSSPNVAFGAIVGAVFVACCASATGRARA